jgi:hypothetical protein
MISLDVLCGSGPRGSRAATARPTNARAASTTMATTYVPFPDARSETRIVPAMAVPKEEPRLETLRDSPEISPCCCSGKLD